MTENQGFKAHPAAGTAPLATWHILGAGAIGGLLACALADARVPCALILRRARYDSCRIRLESAGQLSAIRLDCSDATATDAITHLVVTTKAQQVAAALAAQRHRIARGAVIVLMTNGMGIAETVQQIVPDARVYCAVTTEGAYRRTPRHIVHAGRGTTVVGSLESTAAPAWFGDWQSTRLDCEWTDTIGTALWQKLAINCAINPLTALYRCRNGELLTDAERHQHLRLLCDEIIAVSTALGYHETARSLHDAVDQVTRATAGNRSSMLQDVLAGRPTEIEYITGYLVQRADQVGVPVPGNRAALEAVKHG